MKTRKGGKRDYVSAFFHTHAFIFHLVKIVRSELPKYSRKTCTLDFKACPRPPQRESLRFREYAHARLSVKACAFASMPTPASA
jgi:hypothetical protein